MKSKAINETPSQSYGMSVAICDRSVTCHPTQVNTPHLNPSQTGWYSIYIPWRDRRLSWPSANSAVITRRYQSGVVHDLPTLEG